MWSKEQYSQAEVRQKECRMTKTKKQGKKF